MYLTLAAAECTLLVSEVLIVNLMQSTAESKRVHYADADRD